MNDCIITVIKSKAEDRYDVNVAPHQVTISTFGAADARKLQLALIDAVAELSVKIKELEAKNAAAAEGVKA